MKHRVFISYSHTDQKAVNRLQQTLELLGITVLKDNNLLQTTDDIEHRIKSFIENDVSVLLVALSNSCLASGWVTKERNFATNAQSKGVPIKICFANVCKETNVPDDIKRQLYFDASKPDTDEFYESLFGLVRFFLNRKTYENIGVYDIFESRTALNSRRENADGRQGCDMKTFLCCAQKNVVGVGFWFASLFSSDTGKALKALLNQHPDISIDLYVPHPDEAPIQNLALTHEAREFVQTRIRDFVNIFSNWGMSLASELSAPKLRLHLLRFVPSHVALCIDPYEVGGRMIIDTLTTGMGGEHQLKVELRHPSTPLYQLYLSSLRFIQDPQNIIESISFEKDC